MLTNNQINKAKQVVLLSTKSLLKTQQLCLLGLNATLAVLHLSLVANHPLLNQELFFFILSWASILFLLWQNRPTDEKTTWYSRCLGLLLLLSVILRPVDLWYLDTALFRFGPIVAALGVGLLAFGFPGLLRQWRSLLVLILMLFPYGIFNKIFDNWLHFSHLTTIASAFLLHYIGLKVTYQDVLLTLPTGQVSVGYACTGGSLILWLLRLVLLIEIVFPLSWLRRLGLALCAIFTGFLIGCIRVALLALVVNHHSRFEYWHGSQGGQIFLAASILIFVVLCNWLLPLEELHANKHYEQSIPFPTTRDRKWHYRVLATSWIGVVLAAIYLICVPTAGRRLLSASTLPNTLSLNGWQQLSVNSLKPQTDASIDPDAKSLEQSGRQYKYLRNDRQLEIQMRYVLSTIGEPNPFLKLAETSVKDNQTNPTKLNGIGYHTLYNDGNLAYLTACINPRGGSTVTSAQFIRNRYTYDLTASRILAWVSGKEILKDHRCIWAQLSTPLNGATAADAYQILESVWAANYTTWQSRFPSPLGAKRIF